MYLLCLCVSPPSYISNAFQEDLEHYTSFKEVSQLSVDQIL